MLHFEHVNLVVNDIPAMLDFYQAAFPHWKIRAQGKGEWYGKPRKWLHFGDDYQYLVFNDHGEGQNRDLKGDQIGLAHFAFVTGNINDLINWLENAGYEISNNGVEELWRKNVYFEDPAGFEVEFIQYLSDLPEQRNR